MFKDKTLASLCFDDVKQTHNRNLRAGNLGMVPTQGSSSHLDGFSIELPRGLDLLQLVFDLSHALEHGRDVPVVVS